MAMHFEIECLDCAHRAPYVPTTAECPRCGSQWREARYDLEAIGPGLAARVAGRPWDLWRWLDLLPVRAVGPAFSMGEGGTPLFNAPALGAQLGLPHLYIKDERQSPTASFKDRQASVTVAALKEAGQTELVVASTGNVAIAYAAFCARAGLRLWAFLTSLVPAAKMHEAAIYGTQVVKVTGTYDQAKKMAAEFAQRRGLYLDRGTRSVAAVESMKTIAFEIAEQLAARLGPGRDTPWRSPDWYVQAVSGGIGPVGVLKGFEELSAAGLVERPPAIAAVQTAGCAPMVEAWKAGHAAVTPVLTPRTHIATLSTGDPGRTYTLLRQRLLDGPGGAFESVSDEEAFHHLQLVARTEGLSLEPAAAVAFAGLARLAREGVIRPDQVVVVNCSGHTLPVEERLLDEGWSTDVVYPVALEESPQEGLLAALAQLDHGRFQRVLIVDDDASTRLLIRRLLLAHGEYAVEEAASGAEALAEARRRQPDLVVLDLMMPEMDGFAVLDHFRQQPQTARVPVIVVTAKDLTPAERKRLEGRISRLLTKGDFQDEDLVREISKVLGP